MVTAIVLIRCVRDSIPEVAERIAAYPEISEVYSVAGQIDLVALVRAPDLEGLADVVTRRLLRESAITHTETLIGFRAYSRYDLEHLFSLGLNAPES
jgi:DNA-binding Lrp family transcriptional regulator